MDIVDLECEITYKNDSYVNDNSIKKYDITTNWILYDYSKDYKFLNDWICYTKNNILKSTDYFTNYIYNLEQIGFNHQEKGEYEIAISYYDKALSVPNNNIRKIMLKQNNTSNYTIYNLIYSLFELSKITDKINDKIELKKRVIDEMNKIQNTGFNLDIFKSYIEK